MAVPSPGRGFIGDGGVEPPAVELAFDALSVLAELEQGQGEAAGPAAWCVAAGQGELAGHPLLVRLLEWAGQPGDLVTAQWGKVPAHGEDAAAHVPGETELATALEGSAERRVLSRPGAQSQRTGGDGEIQLEAFGSVVESGGEAAQQPRRARV